MGEREDGHSSEDLIRAARDKLAESRPSYEPGENDSMQSDNADGTPSDVSSPDDSDSRAAVADLENGEPTSIGGDPEPAIRQTGGGPLPPAPPQGVPREPWHKKRWVLVAVGITAAGVVLLVSQSGVFDDNPKEAFLAGLDEAFEAAEVSDESQDCIVQSMEEGGNLDGLEDLTEAELTQFEDFDLIVGLSTAPPALQSAVEGFYIAVLEGGCLSPREMEALAATPSGVPGEPTVLGDDPALDRLWFGCGAGDLVACDILYLAAPVGSEYEDQGATCGGLNEPLGINDPYCIQTHDAVDLDVLRADCAAGDFGSCDLLLYSSPVGSDYEEFGRTCGGLEPDGQPGFCMALYGLGTR